MAKALMQNADVNGCLPSIPAELARCCCKFSGLDRGRCYVGAEKPLYESWDVPG